MINVTLPPPIRRHFDKCTSTKLGLMFSWKHILDKIWLHRMNIKDRCLLPYSLTSGVTCITGSDVSSPGESCRITMSYTHNKLGLDVKQIFGSFIKLILSFILLTSNNWPTEYQPESEVRILTAVWKVLWIIHFFQYLSPRITFLSHRYHFIVKTLKKCNTKKRKPVIVES